MRTFPGASVIGRDQMPSACQVTVAVVDVPFSSNSVNPVERAALEALFQLVLGITPADSLELMALPLPTNLMPIAVAEPPPEALTTNVTVAVCVSVPLVPVIVIVELPAGVVDAVVIVIVELLPAVTEPGLKAAEAPVGNPLADSTTVPLKPFNTPVLTVYGVLFPEATVALPGVPLMVKSGEPLTVNATVVVRVSAPLVPVMVIVELPVGVLPVVVIVNAEVIPGVIDVGLNEAVVAPPGNPLAVKATVPVKPFRALAPMV